MAFAKKSDFDDFWKPSPCADRDHTSNKVPDWPTERFPKNIKAPNLAVVYCSKIFSQIRGHFPKKKQNRTKKRTFLKIYETCPTTVILNIETLKEMVSEWQEFFIWSFKNYEISTLQGRNSWKKIASQMFLQNFNIFLCEEILKFHKNFWEAIFQEIRSRSFDFIMLSFQEKFCQKINHQNSNLFPVFGMIRFLKPIGFTILPYPRGSQKSRHLKNGDTQNKEFFLFCL